MSKFRLIISNLKKLGFALAAKIIFTLAVAIILITYATLHMVYYVASGPRPGVCISLAALTTAFLSFPLWPLLSKLTSADIKKLKPQSLVASLLGATTVISLISVFYTRVSRDIVDRGITETIKAFAFGMLFLAVLACLWVIRDWYRRRRAPLIANLPHFPAEAQEEFGRRIRFAFPPGTEETSLIATLRAQGFRSPSKPEGRPLQPGSAPRPSSNTLRLDFRRVISKQSWTVIWMTDPENRIVQIFGLYRHPHL